MLSLTTDNESAGTFSLSGSIRRQVNIWFYFNWLLHTPTPLSSARTVLLSFRFIAFWCVLKIISLDALDLSFLIFMWRQLVWSSIWISVGLELLSGESVPKRRHYYLGNCCSVCGCKYTLAECHSEHSSVSFDIFERKNLSCTNHSAAKSWQPSSLPWSAWNRNKKQKDI